MPLSQGFVGATHASCAAGVPGLARRVFQQLAGSLLPLPLAAVRGGRFLGLDSSGRRRQRRGKRLIGAGAAAEAGLRIDLLLRVLLAFRVVPAPAAGRGE